MSERRLSKRSQRRLRLRVAQRLAGSTHAVPTKKPRIEPATSTDSEEAGDDGERDEEAGRQLEVTADSSSGDSESYGNEEEGDGTGDDNPSESFAGQEHEGVSDESELSEHVTEDDSSEDSSEDSSDGMVSVSEARSVTIGTESQGTPLYQGSAISSGDFNTAFLSLVQRHNLTYSSQGDILKLLSIVIPSPSSVPSSAYMLYKKFTNYKDDTVLQHICDNCASPLEPGLSCKQQGCADASHGVFVRIPLSMQLKERFDGMFMLCCVVA